MILLYKTLLSTFSITFSLLTIAWLYDLLSQPFSGFPSNLSLLHPALNSFTVCDPLIAASCMSPGRGYLLEY